MRLVQVTDDKATMAAIHGRERVDICKPGYDGGAQHANGHICCYETEMSPGQARRIARLLLYAADRLEDMRAAAKASRKAGL